LEIASSASEVGAKAGDESLKQRWHWGAVNVQ